MKTLIICIRMVEDAVFRLRSTAHGLFYMWRTLKASGCRLRLRREGPGRYRFYARLDGDESTVLAIWNAWDKRLDFREERTAQQ